MIRLHKNDKGYFWDFTTSDTIVITSAPYANRGECLGSMLTIATHFKKHVGRPRVTYMDHTIDTPVEFTIN